MATSNNSTIPDICTGYESYNAASDPTEYIVNYIMAPVGISMCVMVYTLCLLAHLKKATTGEFAYVYQCLYCGAEILLAFNEAIFVLTRYFWAGMYKRYVDWFISCGACMWYSAHMALAACDFCVTLTWMFSICMAADRVFALWAPFAYRKINHKEHQALASLICVLISLFVSAYDWFISNVEAGTGTVYKITVNNDFLYVSPGPVFTVVTTSVRALIGLALIGFNVAAIISYRSYLKKRTALFRDKKEVALKESERALTRFCAFQSAFNVLDIVRTLLGYTLYYVAPKLYLCGEVATLVSYVTRWVLTLGNFTVMVLICKRFREMLLSILCRKTNMIGVT